MRSVLSLVPQPSEFLAAHWYTSSSSRSNSTRLMMSLGVYTSRVLPVYLESEMLTSTWFLLHFVSRVGGKSVLLTTVHWITKSDRYGTSGCPYGVIVRRGVPFKKLHWYRCEKCKYNFANETFFHVNKNIILRSVWNSSVCGWLYVL